jgi:tetratricopeptide (TPR) repeat protein
MSLLPVSFVCILLAVSCSSVRGVRKNTGEGVMYGMVYNDENIPVSGAAVFIDGKAESVTDTQGRFMLISRQRKEFEIGLEKAGYERVRAMFRFEPMEVIHLTMANAGQLVSRAELAMDEGRYGDAEAYCDRALRLDPFRIDAPYLKALSLLRRGEYERARTLLEGLRERIGDKEYIRKALEAVERGRR